MFMETIEHDFREKVCSKLSLINEGIDRFLVSTPFHFDDGDHLIIILKKENGDWILSDEGHTYMHLTYSIDTESLLSGLNQKAIAKVLSSFNIEEWDGELKLTIKDKRYGDALYNYIQALLKLSDVNFYHTNT